MELIAVAFICAAAVPTAQCDRTTALGVMASPVRSPMECAMRAQAMIAGSPISEHLGADAYLKIACERRTLIGQGEQ
jgi:hypothetical protein